MRRDIAMESFHINDEEQARNVFRNAFSKRLSEHKEWDKKNLVSKAFNRIMSGTGGPGLERSAQMMKEIEKAKSVQDIINIAQSSQYANEGTEGPRLIRQCLDEIRYGIKPEMRERLAQELADRSSQGYASEGYTPSVNSKYIQGEVDNFIDAAASKGEIDSLRERLEKELDTGSRNELK